ncbi:MAG: hypothetical protein OFPII_14120 [Osedax symbiont Rs1]|nr:MAG: hypothetical protein OFPII_14120 [Osedax symbiont Rs1]
MTASKSIPFLVWATVSVEKTIASNINIAELVAKKVESL